MEQSDFPEPGEYVIATVKKIMPYGAFCVLEEYAGRDGFLHISQVSSGWVRNIREHLREGQRVVVKVTNVDKDKSQVDISLRQVSEADRKRKLESFQAEKKARKLIEVVGGRLKKTPALSWREAGAPLLEECGSVAAGLEALAAGSLKTQLPPGWAETLGDIVKQEMAPKRVEIRARLSLKSFDSDGVLALRELLSGIEKASDAKTQMKVLYLGAPNYYVDVESDDYKNAEKKLTKVEEYLEAACKKRKCEFSLER
ncbi:MAG: translation initiation factor IF-2 subunit alpha [Candidatus Micrarchaeota archaeon]